MYGYKNYLNEKPFLFSRIDLHIKNFGQNKWKQMVFQRNLFMSFLTGSLILPLVILFLRSTKRYRDWTKHIYIGILNIQLETFFLHLCLWNFRCSIEIFFFKQCDLKITIQIGMGSIYFTTFYLICKVIQSFQTEI